MNTAEMTQTEQLIENNTSYATRVYFNKDERMTEAVKQAIKDTYNVDSIICDGNVLLTKKMLIKIQSSTIYLIAYAMKLKKLQFPRL
ncbi:hypothetical protein [Vibrio parahaemolyticus]|uniref:hypothetical protein n=1 Tax=Vibrio parahaemolyticus TaxID=670 RepID=UPI00235F1FD9|nr:hypothetical protein [Vibrio parahaemolyticus]